MVPDEHVLLLEVTGAELEKTSLLLDDVTGVELETNSLDDELNDAWLVEKELERVVELLHPLEEGVETTGSEVEEEITKLELDVAGVVQK